MIAQKNIKTILLILAIILITVIMIIVLTVYLFYFTPFRGTKFAKSEWISSEIVDHCIRGKMVEDLKDNYLKIGESEYKQILTLLGNGKNLTYKNYKNCLSYSLGMCSGLEVDYDFLYLCFNNDNKLQLININQH